MRIVRLIWLLSFQALQLTAVTASPKTGGAPFLRVWQAEEYGARAGNACVLQHPETGFMYVGNDGGVLEYDGATWRVIPIPGALPVSTLAVDNRRRIWASSSSMICRLEPEAKSGWRARSMLDRLPADQRVFHAAYHSQVVADGIYFASTYRIYFFGDDDSAARSWPTPDNGQVFSLHWIQGSLYVRLTSGRSYRLQNDGWVERPVLPPATKILAVGSRAEPEALVATRLGVMTLSADDLPTLLGGAGENLIVGDLAQCAAFLRDGRIAFGMTRNGVALYNSQGEGLQRIDHHLGLPASTICGMCEDREGGLWLATENGVVRVALDSPFALHGLVQGVTGPVLSIEKHAGRLFLGQPSGLTRQNETGGFTHIEEIPFQVSSLRSRAGRLYASGKGLHVVERDGVVRRLATTTHSQLISFSGAPDLFAHGAPNGLWLAQAAEGEWKRLGAHPQIPGPTSVLLENPSGLVWAMNRTSGLWRIDYRTKIQLDAPARKFGAEDGLPPGLRHSEVDLFMLGSDTVALVRGALFRYDAARERFISDKRVAGFVPPTSVAGQADDEDEPAVLGSLTHVSGDGTVWFWFSGDAYLQRVVPDGVAQWRTEKIGIGPLSHLQMSAMFHDREEHMLWFANPGGLISMDLDRFPSYAPAPLTAVVRRVEDTNGAGLWSSGPAGAVKLELPATNNALRIHFSAPTFAADYLGKTRTFYRSKLEGLEDAWTNWTAQPYRDFTNLPYRGLRFHVQARDLAGRESESAVLPLAIAPPPWLTSWAMGGYTVGLVLMGAGVVRLRTRSLRQRAERLEGVVARRTEELRETNAVLARLNAIERDEKLEARLAEEKARLEMLRYQLNPHFLYNTLTSICGQARKDPEATRTMAQRLADFCRQTLTRGEETESVREELRMLQSYLDIEKTRWRDSLRIETTVAPEVLDDQLPSFLLLPLVENAIKHGGRTTPGDLLLRIGIARQAGGGLHIEVANTGVWNESDPHPDSTGIGLENLRRRLHRYYPDAHQLAVSASGGWVHVKLALRQYRSPPVAGKRVA